jgi:CHAD domain-containing protein
VDADQDEARRDKALTASWKKMVKQGKQIRDLESEQRHEMRKSLKKLCYTVEFFASLYEPDDVKLFVKQLRNLQDVFGYMNDVARASQLESISENLLFLALGAGRRCSLLTFEMRISRHRRLNGPQLR